MKDNLRIVYIVGDKPHTFNIEADIIHMAVRTNGLLEIRSRNSETSAYITFNSERWISAEHHSPRTKEKADD